MAKNKKTFVRHFRIYFKNNHPAYIVDEEGNKYVFHRVTHSQTSGGKKNWKKENPLLSGGDRPMYIVKKEMRDKKNRFSPYELTLKPGADISYPDIKKAGGSQTIVVNNISTSKDIKSNEDKNGNKKTGSTQIHQGDDRATDATSTFIKTNKSKKHKKKK